MTKEEKAEELLIKHYAITTFTEAKQCALITCDEIIDTLNRDIKDLDVRGNVLLDLINYWGEVKQEIEGYTYSSSF